MVPTRTRSRVGSALVAGAIAAGATIAMAVPAAAADGPPRFDPPRINCGVTRTDNGPLSLLVHNLEPLFGPQLAGTLHQFNCAVVTNLEVSLGLMDRFEPG